MYRISACFAASSVHLALYAVPVRAVGISPRTSFPTVRCLPAAVLQVCVSASSRHLVDFHHSSRIASVVQIQAACRFTAGGFLNSGPRYRLPGRRFKRRCSGYPIGVYEQIAHAQEADGVRFELTEGITFGGFQDRCIKPLCHPSKVRDTYLPQSAAPCKRNPACGEKSRFLTPMRTARRQCPATAPTCFARTLSGPWHSRRR